MMSNSYIADLCTSHFLSGFAVLSVTSLAWFGDILHWLEWDPVAVSECAGCHFTTFHLRL